MAKQEKTIPKKTRGRPATGLGTPVMVRLQPDMLAKLDQFIEDSKADLTRPEAIRLILADYLKRRGLLSKE